MPDAFFADDDYLDLLTTFVVKDRTFLRENRSLLLEADFEPFEGSTTGKHRWIVATKALQHYDKYLDPVGSMLNGELKEHIRIARMGDKGAKDLLDYSRKLLKRKLPPVTAVADKLVEFRSSQHKNTAIQELLDLRATGTLTDERWLTICREALDVVNKTQNAIDYKATLEDRISRRTLSDERRYPLLFIDPLDALVRAIARGHLGVVAAPFKRGKSRFLIWIARAYILQGLNVLYVTLEDPREEVEDRFDASFSDVPVHELKSNGDGVREGWNYFASYCTGGLRIIDGTSGMTVEQIENAYLREKENGFTADAVIVDYDEEIMASKVLKEPRMESADTYRRLRRFLARENLLGWTAAQTQRNTESLKVISADKLAEDIGKARKAFFMLTIGRGDWGPNSAYLYVAAHKNDRKGVGTNVMMDPDRMLAYDRDATMKQLLAEATKPQRSSATEEEVNEEFVEV